MDDPFSPRVAITSLTFSDDKTVPIAVNDVVLVVGPNNAGKSATLRAIRDKLQNGAHKSPVLQSLEIQRTGSLDAFKVWLSGWTVQQFGSPPDNPIFQALGHAVHQSQAHTEWQRSDHILGQLSRWFCQLLSADERLQICNPPGNIALARDNPSHPIHFLLRDDKLESSLSTKFRKAFGVDLVVHRNAGNQVPLHIGERPIPEDGEDRVSVSYIERLEKLPTLHTQGDGMRSFAGVLLATSVGRESIMLIDEPEAFLHPPQARLLGTTLVQNRNKERQLFIATHSTDILRGVLDAESTDTRVIRIRRNGEKNTVRLLSNERIKELWGDPLLRYSNILDGLFHESVIVCEADADCRFYSAVLDAIMLNKSEDAKRPDLMFTHCGGKARLSVVVRALREVDVPVRAVADFDVLSEKEPLKSISESLGIDWQEIEADWKIVKYAVDSKKPDLNTDDVKKEIGALLSSITTPTFPPRMKSDIQAILKRSSPWAHAKLVGKSFVPSGDPSKACERLLAKLRAGGLFVVEVGELEGYARTEGGHGPKWVNAVLTRDLSTDPELEAARNFVRELADT
ncbi:AAA family ATPase [Alishewanella sp. BS5-314]|uniref:ATP-dependent nuclease n=1 Tax=Alishewanella sp. BS5-314 TaxID=2755587 RepID=UPI0021BB196B|nr:AAA family ATPase [Alishewanella sp. BS5-314]MCT8126603.1 AAA family ATPase [Alishewanella sp. BS5-314]